MGSRVTRATALALAFALGTMAPGPARATPPPGAPDCRVFPRSSIWHADVRDLPVHPRSADWKRSMDAATTDLHPDFGPSGEEMPYGIPYEVVGSGHRTRSVDFTYEDESDPGPYPIDRQTPIEMGSDRHAIVIDRDACVLYELYALRWTAEGPRAGSGAIWDLGSNKLRPDGWTSADAAGLPIFAGLLRLDEVQAGRVDHAIRVTAECTDRRYLWPARHQAGCRADRDLPPMGARFRLKRSFDISGFREDTQVVLRAMRKRGLIVADNGSNWFFTGTAEDGWPEELLDELKSVPASEFVAVDVSSLMVNEDSGRTVQ